MVGWPVGLTVNTVSRSRNQPRVRPGKQEGKSHCSGFPRGRGRHTGGEPRTMTAKGTEEEEEEEEASHNRSLASRCLGCKAGSGRLALRHTTTDNGSSSRSSGSPRAADRRSRDGRHGYGVSGFGNGGCISSGDGSIGSSGNFGNGHGSGVRGGKRGRGSRDRTVWRYGGKGLASKARPFRAALWHTAAYDCGGGKGGRATRAAGRRSNSRGYFKRGLRHGVVGMLNRRRFGHNGDGLPRWGASGRRGGNRRRHGRHLHMLLAGRSTGAGTGSG